MLTDVAPKKEDWRTQEAKASVGSSPLAGRLDHVRDSVPNVDDPRNVRSDIYKDPVVGCLPVSVRTHGALFQEA